jgi:hypothetical protein
MATGLPTSTSIEIEFTSGVWTDVTSLVNVSEGAITRKVGRSTQLDQISAGSLSFTLDNPSGNFTPDNPLSTYYPNVIEGNRVRWKVTQGGVTYTRFTGWVTQWLPVIEGFSASKIDVVCTDSLGHLSSRQMFGLPETEFRYDSPLVYYTLDHPSDSYYVPFYSAVGGSSLVYKKAPIDGSLALSDGVGALYDDLTCPTWTRGGTSKTSPYLVAPRVNANALTSFSIEVVINIVQQAAFPGDSYGILKFGDISLCYDDGGLGIFVIDKTAGAVRLDYATDLMDGNPHLISITSSASASKLYIDGVLVDTGTALTTVPVGRALDVGRAIVTTLFSIFDYYNGTISHVAVYDTELSATTVANHAKGVNAYYGETIKTSLDAVARWNGVSITHEGSGSTKIVDAVSTNDKKALDVLSLLISGDGGVLYDNGSGLYARIGSALKSSTVELSLDIEADLDGSVSLTRSITEDVAGATVSSYSQSATYVDAEQATNIGTYATSEAPNLQYNELLSIASNIVSVANNHRLSAGQAGIDLANSNSNKYADTLTLLIGDRIRLTNLISAQFGRTYLDAYVQGWSESLSSQGYKFVFDLDAADTPSEAKFDDSTYGRFAEDAGSLTLTSTVSSSATSLSVTSTGLPLTTLAGSYPLDLDLNGERVTVSSAPVSSTSPQTVTVTRGVAPSVARSHTAGETISVYMSGKFAL